jgi:hypothetical protein
MAAYRERQRFVALASDVRCRQIGPCLLLCCKWQEVYTLLPQRAAIVTDPPYKAGMRGYDYTKPRRRPSLWPENYEGADKDFDPTPWLTFPEIVLFGATHYWDRLPPGGSVWCWDKTPKRQRAHFAPGSFSFRRSS